MQLVRLESSTLAAFLTGTIMTTLLLAAQAGGNPLQEIAWILLGVGLSLLTRAYGLHVSSHEEAGGAQYIAAFLRNVASGWPVVAAALPTLAVLLLAAAFDWPDDWEHPDGGVTIGYTTVALNLNVVLLFFWGVIAARQARLSRTWTVVIGFLNAGMGWLVVAVNLALN
ncbi:hypothetical protein A5759_06050 [Mycobacterium sp. 852014-52144_SCH5372336]|nr:hypothetical protein A5759_06050 [Mycobacterium sp. 852014-52144_SCH5372336]